MMKKIKYLTVMAAGLLLGFNSCSNDNTPDDSDVIEGQPATLSLTLVDNGNGNALTTFEAPEGDTDPATSVESKLSDGQLYLFDAGGKLEVVASYDEITDLILTSGVKKVYLVVNFGDYSDFSEFFPEVGNTAATEANLLAEVLGLSEIEDITTPNYFYISNMVAPGSVNIAPGPNRMELNIGRGMAKVNVDMSDYEQPSTGKLSNEEYLIANNPAEMFLVPRYFSDGQLRTPFFDKPKGASDYFDNGEVEATRIESNLKSTEGKIEDVSYATENAINADYIRYGTISYAIIQGEFVPDRVVDVNNDTDEYKSGDNFYRIRYIETAGSETYDRGYYTSFITTSPKEEDVVYQAAITAKPSPEKGGDIKLSVAEYKGTGTESGAYCYYFLGLGDTRITAEGEETARFTVERNMYYYYKVASVADCGAHVPVPEVTIPPAITPTLTVKLIHVPWGVVGGAGGLNPGI